MVLDRDVLALDDAGFAEPFAERSDTARLGRAVADESDDRHRRLLGPRRERPRRRRAAEQHDEVASSQGWHGLSPPRAAGLPNTSLARSDRPVLGATLNRSESEAATLLCCIKMIAHTGAGRRCPARFQSILLQKYFDRPSA